VVLSDINMPVMDGLENLLASHGRGILLTTLQFNEVTYLGNGKQVRLVKLL
jgi:CheY-like chemotaxis protein